MNEILRLLLVGLLFAAFGFWLRGKLFQKIIILTNGDYIFFFCFECLRLLVGKIKILEDFLLELNDCQEIAFIHTLAVKMGNDEYLVYIIETGANRKCQACVSRQWIEAGLYEWSKGDRSMKRLPD